MFEEKLMKEGSAPLLLPDGTNVNVEQGMVSWKQTKKIVSQMRVFFIWMMLLKVLINGTNTPSIISINHNHSCFIYYYFSM